MRLALSFVLLLAACADAGSLGADVGSRGTDAGSLGTDGTSRDSSGAVQDVELAFEDLPSVDLPPLPTDEDSGVCPIEELPMEAPLAGVAVDCVPGRTMGCVCATGSRGVQSCGGYGQWGTCLCADALVIRDVDAGMATHGPPVVLPPRLIAPLSGRRVTSQRPTLHWVLPPGITRARVELCEDRRCVTHIQQVDVTGDSWRSPEVLRPGIVFWKVSGVGSDGTVSWTSATWEFGVGHRDALADTVGSVLKDFNGDGYEDIIAATSMQISRPVLAIIVGARGGGRPTPQYLPVVDPGWITVGDINGDGRTDLVTQEIFAPSPYDWDPDPTIREHPIQVFEGTNPCVLRHSERVLNPAYGIAYQFGEAFAMGDFNGDGFADLMVAAVDAMFMFSGGQHGLSPTPSGYARIASDNTLNGHFLPVAGGVMMIGDVDGDGYEDLAVANARVNDGDGQVQIFYGNPEGRIGARVQAIPSPHGGEFGATLAGADYTGDGFFDLLVGSYSHFTLYVGGRDGLHAFHTYNFPWLPPRDSPFIPSFCAPADLDGDGLGDLVVFAGWIYRSLGSRGFADLPDVIYRGDPSSVGDIDGDGYDDLAFVQYDGRGPEVAPGRDVEWTELFRGGSLHLTRPIETWGALLARNIESQ